jgi:spermidine/putrescine transport system substrate-binding protein
MRSLSTPQSGLVLPRRRLLQTAGIGGAALVAAACGARGGPGGPSASASGAPLEARTQPDRSATERELVWSSWVEYVDEDDDGNRPTLDRFQAETGISVDLREEINDTAEFAAKVRPQLEAGQDIGRDLVVLTDWMAARWIRQGFAQTFDRSAMPNADNLIPSLADVSFDPERDQSLPWQGGYTGLGFNSELLKELTGKSQIRTVQEMWDPALRGRVTILAEMRDSMGLVMQSLGADPANFTPDQFDAAAAEIQAQIDSGQIRQVTGNDYIPSMLNGDVVAAFAWSGDIALEGEPYQFVIPESGGLLWTDDMMVPAMARHMANAEQLMNWYYDPQIAAEVAAWVAYITPVAGAQEAMERIDPDLVDDPFIFPTEQDLENITAFQWLTEQEDATYARIYQSVIGN